MNEKARVASQLHLNIATANDRSDALPRSILRRAFDATFRRAPTDAAATCETTGGS